MPLETTSRSLVAHGQPSLCDLTGTLRPHCVVPTQVPHPGEAGHACFWNCKYSERLCHCHFCPDDRWRLHRYPHLHHPQSHAPGIPVQPNNTGLQSTQSASFLFLPRGQPNDVKLPSHFPSTPGPSSHQEVKRLSRGPSTSPCSPIPIPKWTWLFSEWGAQRFY